MAASRWRTWDTDYFIDVIDSQLPEEGEIISAVGYGRGKPKKDISSLSLPRAALGLTKDEKATDENKLSESRGVGRGQALKERALLGTAPARRPGEKPPTNILKSPDFDLPLSASRFPYGAQQGSHKFRKSQLESEWPSLGSNSGKASSPGAKKRQLSKLPSFAAVSKPMTKPKPSESPIESNYDQVSSVSSESDGSDILIVENLPPSITEKELYELFEAYGNIVTCNVERCKDGSSLGTAVVRMEDRQACEWIVSCFDGTDHAETGMALLCQAENIENNLFLAAS